MPRSATSRATAIARIIPVVAAVSTLVVGGAAFAGTPNEIRVGSDLACDTSSLGTAILLAGLDGPTTTRILGASNQPYDMVVATVDQQSVEIVGGYSACDDPDPGTARTTIDGGPTTILAITNDTTTQRTVVLRNLDLTGGTTSGDGGGLRLEGNLDVTLANVVVQNGSATRGGGIFASGDGRALALTIGEQSLVTSNSATAGGGLYCIDGATVLFEDGAIATNDASGSGGGVFVAEHCHFTSRAGDFLEGIYLNTAGGQGGGIAAQHSESLLGSTYDIQVRLEGNDTSPAFLTGNDADNFGGGFSGSGPSVSFELVNAVVETNDARTGGGGYLAFGATLDMRPGASCPIASPCSRLDENDATLGASGRWGGALRLDQGARAELYRTEVVGNRATDVGSAFHVARAWPTEGDPSVLLAEGVLVADSSLAPQVARITDGADVTLAFATVAGNADHTATLNVNAATLRLRSSIVYDDDGGTSVISQSGGATVEVDCLIAHESASVPPDSGTQVDDPLFVDAAGGDYHVLAGSPAIDFCDTASYVPTTTDIDGQERGYDDPSVVNLFGPFDVGFDEALEEIFSAGFETGDVSEWSSAVGIVRVVAP